MLCLDGVSSITRFHSRFDSQTFLPLEGGLTGILVTETPPFYLKPRYDYRLCHLEQHISSALLEERSHNHLPARYNHSTIVP